MLVMRELGRRSLAQDPEGWGWRSVIGRVFARTSLAFMILAAADLVSTYADLPHKIARLIDIFFVIAFALQGAIWVRELILGIIGRRVAEEQGAGTLGNAMAIIRLLVSVALFAIAGILILDNLGVNVTASLPASASAALRSALRRRGSSPTSSPRYQSCSTNRSRRATSSVMTRAPARWRGSASKQRAFARSPASS